MKTTVIFSLLLILILPVVAFGQSPGETVIYNSSSAVGGPVGPNPSLTGRVNMSTLAVDDDECTGDQGKFWWDSTDGRFEFCENASGVPSQLDAGASAAQGLDANFDVEPEIDGAINVGSAFKVGNGTDFIRIYVGGSGPVIECQISGGDCDIIPDIPSGKSHILKAAGTEIERMTSAIVHSYSNAGKPTKTVYFPANGLEVDGTNCTYGSSTQINSGPFITPINCADSNSSIFYGDVSMLKTGWDAGTVRFSLHIHHATTESITFAGDWSAMCRGDSDTINSTWGTAIQGDLSITTAHDIEQATSGAVTPNGTCAAGDHIFFRFVVDATNFSTNAANANVVGVSMHYDVDTRNGDDES